jgi:carboxymethylenebutenolidase
MVKFAANGVETPGYLATPERTGPAVIVLQEWWGLNDDIKEIAERFAGEGFVALAPDMYHGQSASEPDEARKLAMGLQLEQAAKDLSGAYRYLLASVAVEPKKVGSVGFCMGGSLSIYLATREPTDACVSYYGAPRAESGYPEFRPEQMKAPFLGHYAELDRDLTERGKQLAEGLREAGKEAEVHIYEGAHHSFFNKTRPEVHHPQAAAQSWERTLAFFRKHLY